MVSHGHEVCPHCESDLSGEEPQCPSCNGALYGIAPTRRERVKEVAREVVTTTTSVLGTAADRAQDAGRKAMDSLGSGIERASTKIGEINIPKLRKDDEKSAQPDGSIPIGESTSLVVEETLSQEPEVAEPIESEDESMSEVMRIIQEGEALAGAKRPSEAAARFNQAIALDPTNALCWYNLGVVQEQMGLADESIKSFNVALVHDPDHIPAMANLAVILDALGDPGAADHAKKALVHFPGHPALTRIASSFSQELAPIPDASSQLTEDVEVSPDETPQPVRKTGLVIGTATAPPRSEPIVEEVKIQEYGEVTETLVVPDPISQPEPITHAPDSDDEINEKMNGAAAMLRSGNSAEVIDMIEGAYLERNSGHARPYKILGAAYALENRIEEAISSFTDGLNLDNADAPGWYNLGRLHLRNGHKDAGATCFTAAQMVDSDHVPSARSLVEYYRETEDRVRLIPLWIHLSTLEDLGEGASELASILVEIGEGENLMIETHPELPIMIPEGPDLARKAVDLLGSEESEMKARALSLTGEHTEAIRISKVILESNPTESKGWLLMAKVLESAGETDRAQQCRDKAVKIDGDTSDEVVASSVIIEDTSPLFTSEPESLITTESDDDDPWSTLTDESLDEEQETVIHQEVVIESEPVIEVQTSPASEESTADILLTSPTPIIQPDNVVDVEPQENIDLTKVASDAAAKTDGNSGQSAMTMAGAIEWYNKALFLMEDKKYKEALSCFDKALPGSAEDEDLVIRIINGRGHAFYYLEEYPEAIKAYFEAMRINKEKVTGATLYNMGTAYANVELYDDAVKCFKQAMPRGLDGEQKKMCKEQIRRCNELLKIQKRKMAR
ncbi:MAG: hypothetical protein CMB13_07150 [Euryarchaeota archaeon]|nr:hypothetical protein [Euryarchaeota archaeon]